MLHSKEVTVTGPTPETVFTVPVGYIAEMSLIYVSNESGKTNKVSVYWERKNGEDFFFLKEKALGDAVTHQISPGIFVIPPLSSVKAYLGSSGSAGVLCTFDMKPAPALITDFNGE